MYCMMCTEEKVLFPLSDTIYISLLIKLVHSFLKVKILCFRYQVNYALFLASFEGGIKSCMGASSSTVFCVARIGDAFLGPLLQWDS